MTEYITVTSPPAIVVLPDQAAAPTDPDDDGLYEDLNGNGHIDGNDFQRYFLNMDWIAANEPVSAFDLNANGRIDGSDYPLLFLER
jgi:PKD repeat protein